MFPIRFLQVKLKNLGAVERRTGLSLSDEYDFTVAKRWISVSKFPANKEFRHNFLFWML